MICLKKISWQICAVGLVLANFTPWIARASPVIPSNYRILSNPQRRSLEESSSRITSLSEVGKTLIIRKGAQKFTVIDNATREVEFFIKERIFSLTERKD